MFFYVEANKYRTKESVKIWARRKLFLFPKFANEAALNKYLIKNLKMSLTNACLYLILHATYSTDEDGGIVITFKRKEDEKLAKLITYGTGKLFGSQILKTCFGAK